MKDKSRLVRQDTGEEVHIGDVLTSARDQAKFKVTGWAAPHKASSTGRVFVESSSGFTQGFFPGVFDLKIVDHEFDR
jgi:hypothetical protein